MQLAEKQKTFSRCLAAFLKYRLNFKHFETKMTLMKSASQHICLIH